MSEVGDKLGCVPSFRIAEAAELLGVSDDTVRRWVESGRLSLVPGSGPRAVDGAELARFAQERAGSEASSRGSVVGLSARNRMVGLVTAVTRDTVMAQVEIQAGPFRLVSLLSAQAVEEQQVQPGSLVVASVKSTDVVIELPSRARTTGQTDASSAFG